MGDSGPAMSDPGYEKLAGSWQQLMIFLVPYNLVTEPTDTFFIPFL
jgi:hypothetical protein